MKKLITIVMIAFAAVAAKADLVLYWQVADSTFNGTYAVLQGIDSTGTATGLAGMKLNSSGVTTVESLVAPFSSYADYIVELLDAKGNTIAVSTEHTNGDIMSYIYDRGTSAQPPSSPYSFSGFVVPEPTSAMLIMLGLGALALRRRLA